MISFALHSPVWQAGLITRNPFRFMKEKNGYENTGLGLFPDSRQKRIALEFTSDDTYKKMLFLQGSVF
ncbi:hypothetical protein BWI97_13015 [Siphonobacter sp. BAB-5405]|nr:hypothetical protein BWI97_13015 [Siphonobacter sp. BAB-5405]